MNRVRAKIDADAKAQKEKRIKQIKGTEPEATKFRKKVGKNKSNSDHGRGLKGMS